MCLYKWDSFELTGGLYPLEERDVEHEVDDADAAHHLGVRRPRVEDATAVVDLQDLATLSWEGTITLLIL